MSSQLHRVLFVCMGNICRSPLAEALFADLCRQKGLDGRFLVDSAGTGSWHVGERADPRTIEVGERHGLTVDSVGRQVDRTDFDEFDVIVAMDRRNLSDLRARCPATQRHKLKLMGDFDAPEQQGADVPDPYYGGEDGFEQLHRQLATCCRNLLDALSAGGEEQS